MATAVLEYLFDPSLIRPHNLATGNLIVRPLERGDFSKGYTKLLEQLTVVGEVGESEFISRFDELKAASSTYWIVVIEDATDSSLLATGTLVIEKKFTHSAGKVGHIEDVVVDSTNRGQNLGKTIVTQLREIGKAQGCYKIILDCTPEKTQFYLSCGFHPKERQMAWYIDAPSSSAGTETTAPPVQEKPDNGRKKEKD
jgi:glucosamine-phosphate N-acetyltransferase